MKKSPRASRSRSESSDGFFDFQWKSGDNTDENFKNVDYAFLSYEKEDDYIREHIKKNPVIRGENCNSYAWRKWKSKL